MITLEQIRLLESKISRALEVIRVLKEENGTLRKGLESAQKRMRELETLVDGFKTDQKEIESIIVRTLHNLDDLEETTAGTSGAGGASASVAPPAGPAAASGAVAPGTGGTSGSAASPGAAAATAHASPRRSERQTPVAPVAQETPGAAPASASKEELDIF